MRILLFLTISFISCISISGCRDRTTEPATGHTQNNSIEGNHVADNVDSVAIAYALGGKGDRTYNDAANEGAQWLIKEKISLKEFEPSSLDDYAKGLDLLSLSEPDIIFCIGYLYDEPVSRISLKHPSILYVILDGSAVGENVCSVKFNAEEGSFLAGAVAATLTDTKTIAFIGGSNIPPIKEFLTGFQEGAAFVEPAIEVLSLYIGTGGTAFTDPVKGREIALSAISRNADVLYAAAGSSGNGAIKAAAENEIWAIGVDVDQSFLAPNTVATSMLKNFDVAMQIVIERYNNDKELANRNHLLGLSDGAVSLAPLSDAAAVKCGDIVTKATDHLTKTQ